MMESLQDKIHKMRPIDIGKMTFFLKKYHPKTVKHVQDTTYKIIISNMNKECYNDIIFYFVDKREKPDYK